MSVTAKTQIGLDDILSVTSSVEAAAAAAFNDSNAETPQSPERKSTLDQIQNYPSSHITLTNPKSSTSLTSQNICSILNKTKRTNDAEEKSAQTNYEKELEPVSHSFLGAKSPSPSSRSQSPNPTSPQCPSPKPSSEKKESTSRPKNLFASARKSFRRSKVQKQYTIANMYPTPMFKSMDLDSPDGSFSSMGFVGSALGVNMPFASQSSMNSAANRRARMSHNRTRSVISRNGYDSTMCHHSSAGRLFRANSTRHSAMASYDNLQVANGGGGSLHSPSAGLLNENNLQYGVRECTGLDNTRYPHSMPGSTNILPQNVSPSGGHSPRYHSRSPTRFRSTQRLNRQVTLNPECLSSDTYQRRCSPTNSMRLQTSLQMIPSSLQSGSAAAEQEPFLSGAKSPPYRQRSIMKQRSLPVNEDHSAPLSQSRILKDDQGFLKPENVPFTPSAAGGIIKTQASIDSHRSSVSSVSGIPPCTSPGSPNSRSTPGIIRQLSSSRSPRSPNMSRQISKLSDHISMIDEEAEDAIEAASTVTSCKPMQPIKVENGGSNSVTTTECENNILPTSQRITPSLRQLSFMRSTAADNNYRSFGTGVGSAYFNSQSSRQNSFSRPFSGLKRQVTICEDTMSIPESGKMLENIKGPQVFTIKVQISKCQSKRFFLFF